MSKAGIDIMSKSLAVEWAKYGIRLNTVGPGEIPTEGMSKRLNPGEQPGQRSIERNPMARPGQMSELQNLAAFLMAPGQCDWLTGQSIMMDGGSALATGGNFYELRSWSDDDWRVARERIEAQNAEGSGGAMNNAEQIADWNGEQGRRWADHQQRIDRMIEPYGDAALQAAAARPANRCWTSAAAQAAPRWRWRARSARRARVHGVDISQPMLAVAQAARCRRTPELKLSFAEADASSAALPAGQDLLFSRFGLMFFEQPAAALRHLRSRAEAPAGAAPSSAGARRATTPGRWRR